MSDEAAPGDIVTLNSGGPDLTVLRVYDDPAPPLRPSPRMADLGWFTAAGEYRTGTLPLAVLRLRSKVERIAPARRAQVDGPPVGSEPCDHAPRNAHLWPGGRIPGR